MYYTRRITRPLETLTEAARQVNEGNYDFTLDYDGNDEIGKLTGTFRLLVDHVKEHISDLSQRVYVDALTSVRNKGAFSATLEELQGEVDSHVPHLAFAIGVFDCDNLKRINDRYGHDKGDLYLKTACRLICRVFQHSPVFRIGGDEFAVVLKNEDYERRVELKDLFERSAEEINTTAANEWEQVHVAMGVADYDPQADAYVIDVVRRADKTMYTNKRERKETTV